MELLAPAGNIEKLKYAYEYGADAAYIGIRNFSLRAKADNFKENEHLEIAKIKGDKKLYCALNIYFMNEDIKKLEAELEYFQQYPFDGFIISDLGILNLMKKYFPDKELHLSTQANCTNSEVAKLYYDLGFSRIVPAREISLKNISEIKTAVPNLEIECFAHGAMCIAYSGRCFLSSWMTDRSANQGSCSHSCRWDYKVLEEGKRPGEYYPIEEHEHGVSIMSSKDISMINHLKDMRDAGVDSLKIEGRMKSIYYTSVVTRAYRKTLDDLNGIDVPNLKGYQDEINKVSHREFSTGFYYDNADISRSSKESYSREFVFLGAIGRKQADGTYLIDVKNQIVEGDDLEFIGPDLLYIKDSTFELFDKNKERTNKTDHCKTSFIKTSVPVKEGYIIRKQAPELLGGNR
ncbi:MAG: U32 family peptidase [Spirochaetaceae bacterium]